MAQNISITDKNGVKHFIFYHNIIGVDMGLQDIGTGDPYYRCTVYYLALSSYPALVTSTICTKSCTVEGEKAQRLYTAVRNGVLDLDEGDGVAKLDGYQGNVFFNHDLRPAPQDTVLYGYYLEDGQIVTQEVYLDEDGDWWSCMDTQENFGAPLLYSYIAEPPQPSQQSMVEALRRRNEQGEC